MRRRNVTPMFLGGSWPNRWSRVERGIEVEGTRCTMSYACEDRRSRQCLCRLSDHCLRSACADHSHACGCADKGPTTVILIETREWCEYVRE